MPATSPQLAILPFQFEFDRMDSTVGRARGGFGLRLPVPHLGGESSERLFEFVEPLPGAHGFTLGRMDDLAVGYAVQPIGSSLQGAAFDLYSSLLKVSAGRRLYRVWNFVPAINASQNGVENYHAFCAGRSQAFEASHGAQFKRALPSASAVGCEGAALAVIFVAGSAAPRHVENPEQVPAYDYPKEHGPRPPSFSRATIGAAGERMLGFISGTASIKGHVTVAPNDLSEQIDCTLDNLRLVSREAGLGEMLGREQGATRWFKVYVRHASDYPAVRARLESELIKPGDRVVYLRADICRAPLKVEIEVTVRGRGE